jgi:signal transduction histidine kinase
MYWGIPTAIPLIALVCYGALLFITARQGFERRVNRFFALYLLSMLVWSFGAFMMYIDSQHALFWNKAMLSGFVGMPMAFFGFIRSFLSVKGRSRWLYLGFISFILLLVINAQGYLTDYVYFTEDGRIRYQFGPGVPLLGVYFTLLIGFSALDLMGGYRQTTDPIVRNRIKYAFIGVSAIVLGGVTNVVPALGAYPIDIAANVINAVLLAYAIFRYQLLDITLVIRKGLLYSIPAAIIGIAYFLLISLAVRLFHTLAGPQIFLLSLVVAAIAAVVAQPLRDKVQSWVDRLFFREKYDSSLMFQRLSGAVASILDLDRLTNMILDEVTTTMHVERAAFFLKQDESGESRLMAQRGLDQNSDLRLRKDHPIVDWLSSHEHALTRRDVELMPQFRALWGEEREDLERMGVELFIPLKAKGQLMGIFAVGPKLSEETYSQDDQLTLTTLANQTAVAIENARLYWQLEGTLKELRKAHDELERRVEERTAELARANEALQAEIAERKRAEAAIEQRSRELATLLEASQRLAGHQLDLDELLGDIARSIVEVLPAAEASSLWLFDERRNELVVRAWAGYDDEAISGLALSPDNSLAGLVYRSRQPHIVDDITSELAFKVLDRPVLNAMRSALGVPLLVEDRSIGTLFADNFSRLQAFDGNDLRLLQSLAAEAAVVIQNAHLFEQVRAGRERLQALSRRLVEVQEAERRHTALELHDEIGQILTGLKFTLEMSARVPADTARASLDEARAQVNELIMRVDDLSLDLRPAMLDDLGLLPALLWHFKRYSSQTDVGVTFRHTGLEGRRFAPEVETAAYRIVQEALTNVARHADASEVMVRAWANHDMLGVQIEDQGGGFDPEAALAAGETTGVAGMRDRAGLLGGKLTIESAPGSGTGLTAEFPLGDYPLERREMER